MNTTRFQSRTLLSRGVSAFAGLSLSICFGLILCHPASAQTAACTRYWTCIQSQLQLQQQQNAALCTKAAAGHAVGGVGTCLSHLPAPNQPVAVQACSRQGLTCAPGVLQPHFMVLSLLYAPPGSSSSAGFSQ
jgi:hypothetical protein